MLDELSKKDKLWRQIAWYICRDRSLADDLVQEMYLRFHRNPRETITDFYVTLILKSLFSNYIRDRKEEMSINNLYYLECKNRVFEPSDEEQAILDKFDKLDWRQQELIAESYDRSLRDIEKIYPLINYGYAHRQIKEAREIILKAI